MRPATRRPRRARRSRWTRPRRRSRSRPGCRRQHHQQERGGGGRHHQWHGRGRHRRSGGQRPDRDDHDRRRHQRRQGYLYGDGDRRGMVGQRDGGAGARPGRRQLQHQGERIGCGRQCGGHGKPGDRGGRDRPDDRDHGSGRRGQHHQQERGGGGRHHQRHGDGGAAVQQSTARPRRSRSSTAPTPSRTPIRRR